MKRIYTVLTIAILSSLAILNLKAQTPTLEIQKSDQSVMQLPISNIEKLTFSNDAMTIHYKEGQSGSVALTEIGKMFFGTISGIKKLQNTSNQILVYPNPATDYIYLKNKEYNKVQIINTSGVTVMTIQSSLPEMQINISHLPKGIYIIKLDQNVVKFTKI